MTERLLVGFMKQALSLWVEQEEKRYQLTLKALAEIGPQASTPTNRYPYPSCG
jgi:hypothetical protein